MSAPDTIWETQVIAGREIRIGRPNYAEPGVRERIAREAVEAEFAAQHISNIGTLTYFAEVERLNGEHPCECCLEPVEDGLWCAECRAANSQFGVGA